MEAAEAANLTRQLLPAYDPARPAVTAEALREVWLQAAPPRGTEAGGAAARDWGIDAPGYEAVGTPVPVLSAMGREVGRVACRSVADFLLLARLLWDQYGREGRIVAAVALGPMELADPERVVPEIYDLAQSCVFWEDCDQLAMKALEPVLRQDPATWLERMSLWVTDENRWVCRTGLIAIGRLPMVQPEYTGRCVELLAPALGDPDTDVKRGLSFALRLCARGDVEPVKAFILHHQDVTDAASLWVLCDVIRSLWKAQLPQFADLLPVYRAWLQTGEPRARRSIEGAIRVLEGAQSSAA